ncbi:MAG: PA2169 family four-helix-bundle protein [Ferruginibacter sp.]
MKNDIKKTIEVLNDLVKINNDRVAGYEKAKERAGGMQLDIIRLFNEMIDQSHLFADRLQSEILAYGGEVEKGTTIMGKVYRAWMDLKVTFSGDDRQSILNSCELGEDAAQKAYDSALEEEDITESAISLILLQKSELRDAHDRVKKFRDNKVSNSL